MKFHWISFLRVIKHNIGMHNHYIYHSSGNRLWVECFDCGWESGGIDVKRNSSISANDM